MSFDILSARMYGTGALGNVTNPTGQINSYAKVTAVLGETITLDLETASLGVYEKFEVGTEILLHISGVINSSADVTNLGKYKLAKILSVNGDTLTLNVKPLDISTTDYFYQAITVAQFKKLTLSGTLAPLAFDEAKGYGGIVAFKCSTSLSLTGSINLVDKGLSTVAYRPLLNQEQNGTLDTDQLSGYENYETVNHFVLNKGDGACMIIAKKITCNSSARIGNPSLTGVARCRGAEDSYNLPTNVTNVGGSTILIAAPTIEKFSANIIAKYRSNTLTAGQGLCRCYIATESLLPNDEGLYAYDIINTPERLNQYTCINSFGDGSHGELTATNATKQQNSYAQVKSISTSGNTFSLANINQNGVAKFEQHALVMVHITPRNTPTQEIGRFFLTNIVSTKNSSSGSLSSITLEKSISALKLDLFNISDYFVQVIAIPQYSQATINVENKKTLAFEKGRGGIFAIAVSGTCDLSDGKINVEDKGTNASELSVGYSIDYISCASMKTRLPIGEGHGSVFILANNLVMNSATRIGATYSGNSFGGASGKATSELGIGGGYKGHDSTTSTGGSGAQAGADDTTSKGKGGFSDEGTKRQGAHIFIVAQKITGCRLAALSTGGAGGEAYTAGYHKTYKAGKNGGCGYGGGGGAIKDADMAVYETGGGGGYHGGGGGAAVTKGAYSYGGGAGGFCCIYANQVVSQNTTNLTVD